MSLKLRVPGGMLTTSIAGKICVPNYSDLPVVLRKGQQFAQVLPTKSVGQSDMTNISLAAPPINEVPVCPIIRIGKDNQLPPASMDAFDALHKEFSSVFNPQFTGYNGASGPIKAVVNIGPVEPPQRKGRVPQYSRDKLVELQQKCDELELLGVLPKPEELGVIPEYLNLSFLVKKPSGDSASLHHLVKKPNIRNHSQPQTS